MPSEMAWWAWLDLMRRRRLSPNTIRLRDRALHDLWADLDARGKTWRQVDPEDLDGWLERVCRPRKRNGGLPLSDGSRNTYGHVALTFYAFAAERGLLASNPLVDVAPPPRPRARPRALQMSAIGELLVKFADDRRLTMIVALGFHQGLRIGEICRLSVGDLDLAAEVPQIYVKGKGGRDQEMDLSPALQPTLAAWLVYLASWHQRTSWGSLPSQTPLIPNYRFPHQHLSPNYGAHLLAAAMRPVVGASGHALRRTGSTQLARLTRDPYLVQQFLRHASLDMQAFYVDTNVGLLAAALAQLPDPLKEAR